MNLTRNIFLDGQTSLNFNTKINSTNKLDKSPKAIHLKLKHHKGNQI